MPSKSKNKGSSFERDVAKKLSDLFGESFIRVTNSGAYIGGRNTYRKDTLSEAQIRHSKGDIVPGPSFVRMNVEVKNYADFPFYQLFTGSCRQLDAWIEQMLEVADEGDFNMLFMKFNRKGTFIAVPYNSHWDQTLSSFTYKSQHQVWQIFDLEQFLNNNKELIAALCR
jgi:Holliday junction resolvase